MAVPADTEARSVEEEERVVAWRFDQLRAYRYPPRAAYLIARNKAIDLELARKLVATLGCPPALAARIVL
ncbi:MAG TPA: hypothetical protein VE444_07930 [Gaiellaceae bacterium]|jgi:hypothetical protein|nr:hypothetical protein [Gaiellaceae bacterium]